LRDLGTDEKIILKLAGFVLISWVVQREAPEMMLEATTITTTTTTAALIGPFSPFKQMAESSLN